MLKKKRRKLSRKRGGISREGIEGRRKAKKGWQ